MRTIILLSAILALYAAVMIAVAVGVTRLAGSTSHGLDRPVGLTTAHPPGSQIPSYAEDEAGENDEASEDGLPVESDLPAGTRGRAAAIRSTGHRWTLTGRAASSARCPAMKSAMAETSSISNTGRLASGTA